jgi:hypothetical protein
MTATTNQRSYAMKYYVTLEDPNIFVDDRKVTITAISAVNAKEIAEMRYKGKHATQAIRIGKGASNVVTMNNLCDRMQIAIHAGNHEEYKRLHTTFGILLLSIKKGMDAVAFSMASKHLPEMPIFEKQ